MKKLLSLLLVGAMTLSLTTAAFAVDPTPITTADGLKTASQVAYDGETKAPSIKVTMSTNAGDIIVNPYKMSFEPTTGADPITDQIYSTPGYITNESDVALRVMMDGSVTATGVELSAKSAAKNTTKSAYLYAQVMKVDSIDEAPTKWSGTNFVLSDSEKGEPTQMLVMAAKPTDGDPSYAAFHVAGDLATELEEGATWAAADTLDVTLKFTFEVAADGSTK